MRLHHSDVGSRLAATRVGRLPSQTDKKRHPVTCRGRIAQLAAVVGQLDLDHIPYVESVFSYGGRQSLDQKDDRESHVRRIVYRHHERKARGAAFFVFRHIRDLRLLRADLRVYLVALPEAVPRPRGVRAVSRTDHLHGRHGDRFLGRIPILSEDANPDTRLRRRRSNCRRWCADLSRRLYRPYRHISLERPARHRLAGARPQAY